MTIEPIPPRFILDAIPGATELAEAAIASRTAYNQAGQSVRDAGAAARALSTLHISDPATVPKLGVTRQALDDALDAYRVANDELRATERTFQRAFDRLHNHVRTGKRASEFVDQHIALGDKAHDEAAAAFTAFKSALRDRDTFDQSIGRRRVSRRGNVVGFLDDRTHHLDAIGELVAAPTADETLAARLEAADRKAAARDAFRQALNGTA